MTIEEETKILEEISKEIVKRGRLLYSYEIRVILDRFIVNTDCLDEDAKQASIPYTYNDYPNSTTRYDISYLHKDSITINDTQI